MQLICLLIAGALRASLPTSELTLAWTHSVEKTSWEEDYRVDEGRLRLVRARIEGSGAGMDPPAGATLRGGYWTWEPANVSFAELRLTLSPYTRDYELCWHGRCTALHELVEPATNAVDPADAARATDATEVVIVRTCEREDVTRPPEGPA